MRFFSSSILPLLLATLANLVSGAGQSPSPPLKVALSLVDETGQVIFRAAHDFHYLGWDEWFDCGFLNCGYGYVRNALDWLRENAIDARGERLLSPEIRGDRLRVSNSVTSEVLKVKEDLGKLVRCNKNNGGEVDVRLTVKILPDVRVTALRLFLGEVFRLFDPPAEERGVLARAFETEQNGPTVLAEAAEKLLPAKKNLFLHMLQFHNPNLENVHQKFNGDIVRKLAQFSESSAFRDAVVTDFRVPTAFRGSARCEEWLLGQDDAGVVVTPTQGEDDAGVLGGQTDNDKQISLALLPSRRDVVTSRGMVGARAPPGEGPEERGEVYFSYRVKIELQQVRNYPIRVQHVRQAFEQAGGSIQPLASRPPCSDQELVRDIVITSSLRVGGDMVSGQNRNDGAISGYVVCHD